MVTALLDLDYGEDSHAEVDFNVVGTDKGTYVEVQGTAEGKAFCRAQMDSLLTLADSGLRQLFEVQSQAVARGQRIAADDAHHPGRHAVARTSSRSCGRCSISRTASWRRSTSSGIDGRGGRGRARRSEATPS